MNRKSALQVLHQRTADDLDAVSVKLSSLACHRQQALEQQQLLQHYQHDYLQLLRQETCQGITQYRQENYQQFLTTLDHTLTTQQADLIQLDQQQQQLFSQWQQTKRRLSALQLVMQKRERRQRLAESRAEQKANDEFSARLCLGAAL